MSKKIALSGKQNKTQEPPKNPTQAAEKWLGVPRVVQSDAKDYLGTDLYEVTMFHQSLRSGRRQRRGHVCTEKLWTFREATASPSILPPRQPGPCQDAGSAERRRSGERGGSWLS